MSGRSAALAYPEMDFGGYPEVDTTIAFYCRLRALLDPEHRVLDLGCGRGLAVEDPCRFRRELRDLRSSCSRVIGADLDATAAANPFLHEFRRIEDEARWPLDDGEVDLVLADWVLEHLPDPALFFTEAARILGDGGHLCIRTPNRWGYPVLAARLVPSGQRARLLERVQPSRRSQDVFPAFYRCNGRRLLRRRLNQAGFVGVVLAHRGAPAYLGFAPWLLRAGKVIHRWLPAALSPVLLVFARRSGGAPS